MEPQITEGVQSYIDKKFEEQEHIIQRMMADQNRVLIREIKAQKQKNNNVDRTKYTIKAIIFNFLIILLIIWLLYYFNDTKIVEMMPTTLGRGDDGNEGIRMPINWVFEKILKHLLESTLRLSVAYFLLKNSYFPPSEPPENDNLDIDTDYDEIFSIFNEVSESQAAIQEILDNIENSDEAYNFLDILSSEYNKREEMLSKIEYETEKILAELESDDISIQPAGVESTNHVSDSNDKKDTEGVGKSLIISACILGSSMIISNIIPTLMEILIK